MTLDPAETALEQALSAHEKTARDNAAAREQRPSDARPDLDALHETTDATVKAWLAVKSLVDEAQRIAEQGRPALLQRAQTLNVELHRQMMDGMADIHTASMQKARADAQTHEKFSLAALRGEGEKFSIKSLSRGEPNATAGAAAAQPAGPGTDVAARLTARESEFNRKVEACVEILKDHSRRSDAGNTAFMQWFATDGRSGAVFHYPPSSMLKPAIEGLYAARNFMSAGSADAETADRNLGRTAWVPWLHQRLEVADAWLDVCRTSLTNAEAAEKRWREINREAWQRHIDNIGDLTRMKQESFDRTSILWTRLFDNQCMTCGVPVPRGWPHVCGATVVVVRAD